MSPMKKPKFSVAASSTKKPKTTFSKFTRTSRRRLPLILARRLHFRAPNHTGGLMQRAPPPVREEALDVRAGSALLLLGRVLVRHEGADAGALVLEDGLRAGLPAVLLALVDAGEDDVL